ILLFSVLVRIRLLSPSPLCPYTTLFRSCGACSGTAPGSSVRIPNSPSSFVGHRPKPRKPGTAPLGSSGWSNRPFGSACHVSINRSEEHTSELQSRENLVCRLLLEKKKST